MNDPNIVTTAPSVTSLLDSVSGSREGARDRARGAMLGLAVGNLLGLPVEGWHYREIDRSYYEGVTDIDPREAFRPMDDDLAQVVALGEALLEGGDYIGGFAGRLVTWARENGRGIGITTGRVIDALERGHAPPDAVRLVYESNPIAPNGGVMRCAPVALARHRQPERLVRDSAASCVVTHYAVACQWSCIVVNAVIAMLLRGVEPDLRSLMTAAASDGAPDMLATALDDGIPAGVLTAIEDGVPMVSDCSWLRRQQMLIGHTLLALQCGLWAAVTPLDLEAALRRVVEAGGDTDTNAAVAGAVLGARYGASAIPERWVECIPERDRIEGLADALIALSS